MVLSNFYSTFGGVKGKQLLIIILGVLGMMFFMPSILYARSPEDSLVLNRVFDYHRNYGRSIEGFQDNAYLKYKFHIDRRNVTLWLIPTMYSVADGPRDYLGESYCRLTYHSVHDYEMKRQVSIGNISHYKKALPTVLELLTPDLYNTCLFKQHILSPFSRTNKRFYSYRVTIIGNGLAVVAFKPRLANTQLVKGQAYVLFETGKISSVEMEGEYNMIDFRIDVSMGESTARSVLPEHSEVEARFSFMGNRIRSKFEAVFHCPEKLADTLESVRDIQIIERVRPIPLEEDEQAIYNEYYGTAEEQVPVQPDTTDVEETPPHKNFWKDVVWDGIGSALVTTQRAHTKSGSISLSPILNPQYISYSRHRGLSYKMRLGGEYFFSPHRYLTLNAQVGYNFKYHQLYLDLPLRMTYNPKREGYAEIQLGNGNRISNSTVLEKIIEEHPEDSTQFNGEELDYFKDNFIKIKNNVEVFDWITVMTSVSYHYRKAVNPTRMEMLRKPTIYRTFAPVLTLKFKPWYNGPIITADYERGIKGVLNSDIGYERWEFDGSWKIPMRSLSLLNVRAGAGFYTSKSTSYFLDYDNFRDNNVPGGWDDDWTGQFQLLDASWYNNSKYYVRANMSYESPMIFATWLPLVGRYIESERAYFSALLIQHTRPYFELGYGLTNRYFSAGVFASFLNTRFYEFGTKFSVELFRKW